MNRLSLTSLATFLRKSHIGIPILLLCILSMVMLPLPPLVLDILFTFNIVLSILVLLVSVNSQKPLDFAIFPTILLITTLMRLTLNVASTRVVLLHGHEGNDAAGKVIEAFGQVVIGGNYIVGFVVFMILMIINFIVVTKGAERISEVSARFTLDALPGKQMAIDADLNAGLLTAEQAIKRRKEIANEADFYGSMDGASKFVRGDAIAGIMILLINVIGGVCIGIFMHDMDVSQAFQQYVLLTIGDGLVGQIPSLLLSTSAAIIVTRVSDSENKNISDDFRHQLLASPLTLYTAAFVMFILAIVPGMPHFPFLTFTALLLFVAWRQQKQQSQLGEEDIPTIQETLLSGQEDKTLGWDAISFVEPIGLFLGYKLIPLLDSMKSNALPQRLLGVRQILSENNGVLIPEINIRENFRLKPNQYSIFIRGVSSEQGVVYPEHLMAIPSAETYGSLEGIEANDPAYGLPVVWVPVENKTSALNLGYQVVDCASVIATHTNKVIQQYLPELFNYEDINPLQARLSQLSPKLTEDLNNSLSFSQQLKIYRQLLLERVPLKDIVSIATTLVESSAVTKDAILLTADVRYALRRSIMAQICKEKTELQAYTLNQELENILLSALQQAQQTSKVSMDTFPVDPNILNQFQSNMPIIKEQMKSQGAEPVLLITPRLRPILARYARLFAPGLYVISYNEVPDHFQLNIMGTLG